MSYLEKRLFGKELYPYLFSKKEIIKTSIQDESEDYILNIGQEQYIDYLFEKNKIDIIEIFDENIIGDEIEESLPVELSYQMFNSNSNSKVPIIYYKIPFAGEEETVNYISSSVRYHSVINAYVSNNEIVKRITVTKNNYSEAERKFKDFKVNLDNHVRSLNFDLKEFNSNLKEYITDIFMSRKNEFLKRREIKAGLNIPVRKKDDISKTFSIPSVKVKKKITVKPIETTENFIPDPTLDDKTYNDILKIINDMGKQFERIPSVFRDKGEEVLRDHFLMMLEPNFEGSATGETFNKSGKTDILLRYNGGNVFVGECKFWTGGNGFLKTIDQLLGYLTWRDSKTSVIMFVDNKDFTNVIKTAKESIQTHKNFIKFVDEKDESWFNYIFHLNGDSNKEIKVAVMLYHIPKDE
ncbi:hypothetical protein [Lysinibacillus sp. NPDC086135]|uniref:hypothetical protein n=1 Tax=Lysinibacillus sp. NPDC086135 TaxID=3364130 RepID=UPI0038169141